MEKLLKQDGRNAAAAERQKPCIFYEQFLFTFRVSRRRRENIVVTRVRVSVCLSVCLFVHGRMPTLLHGPGCNLEEW